MVSHQDVWQTISKLLVDNKDLVRILLAFAGSSVTISGLIRFIWWYRNQQRQRKFPPPIPSPFEIIRPNSDVLSIVFPDDKLNDPLANASIRYQDRCPTRQISVLQELIQKLRESDWLLIEGRTGLGKTREAGELAQFFNNEGWTVLWLKLGKWVDEPTLEHLGELNNNRKLLFLLDDLNQRMSFASTREKNPQAETLPLAPITEPLQNLLLRSLITYERFCNEGEMKVVATARNERFSDIPGQPSAWDKLEKDKYPQFWNRFTVYELPAPEDEAISQLLRDTIPETGIHANKENYLSIARQNDGTFRNVVENLVRLHNLKLPLTPNNYRDTLKENWSKRYQDAVKRYSIAVHLYDAVDLLQQLGISLTRAVVEPTALLIMNSQPWQLWHRYSIGKVLDYLIDAELILTPRDGQIEARERTVELNKKCVRGLSKLVLGLTEKQPESMLDSLYNLAFNLNNYSYYHEALACLEKIIDYLSDSHKIYFVWINRGVVLEKLNRYEDALQSYDKALKLKPDNDQDWYNKACVYSLQNSVDLAVENLAQAINLNRECREYAKTDSDFDNIRENPKFKALIEQE